MVPTVGKVELRKGFEDYVSGSIGSDNVEMLAALKVGATEYFVCGTNNKIYEITNGGAPADRTGAAVITTDRWQWSVFAASAAPTAPNLLMCNGTDQPLLWTGAGNVAAWSPTGPTVANLIGVHVHKNRVYVWEKNSRDFWYSSLGAFTGAFTRFPLSGIRGGQGNLLFMATWTRDGGNGPDDYAAFVTEAGNVIIYSGTDPGVAASWQLVGVYTIPRPLGIRCWQNVLGDLAIATDSDIVFLSEAIQEGGVTTNATKLSGAMRTASATYRTNYGWELMLHPRGERLYCNVPITTNSVYHQYVVETQTRGVCRFTGWNMRCFGLFAGNLYGGGSGKVYRLDIGRSDDADGTPTAIELRARTAFYSLGTAGQKQVTASRLLMKVSETLTAGYRMSIDFSDTEPTALSSTGTGGVSPVWDTALWDSSYWETQVTSSTARGWRAVGGRGTDFSLGIYANVREQAVEWLSTDYMVAPAGGL
jgi:hypothetical protein